MNLSVIIPVYNEINSIGHTVESVIKYISENDFFERTEIIIVDDGSTDGSIEIIKNLSDANPIIKTITHQKNNGVGAALWAGFKKACFENIYWLPADNQVPITELNKLLKYIDSNDIVVGNRYKRNDNFLRSVFSRTYSFIINLFFDVKIRDINATKLFKKKVVDTIDCRIFSGFFDAEFLILSRRNKFKIIETDVEHQPRSADSQKGASLKTIFNIITDLIKNIIKYKF
ncbi:glycosyltransferase family 2 protein [Candidatus Dependentiae bacterium]|nr:glycosyltransferase family 2 protein [Candidatus Dependentiae bacterium]